MKYLLVLSSLLLSCTGVSGVKVGAPAPDFSENTHVGKTLSLADLKGKWTVLEWYNEDCPYVKKHYGSKNMQNLQRKFTAQGVQWVTVSTSAEGKQGYIAPEKAQAKFKEAGMFSTTLLLDADGNMGKAYGAKTTPHMFVINPEGQIAYAGAIDSNDSANPKVIADSENYVDSALVAALAGKPIKTASTKPYGCSVKY